MWHSRVFIGIGRSVWIESECVRVRVYVCTCYRDNVERRGKMRAKLKILYKMKIIYAWKYRESSLQTEITSIYLFIFFVSSIWLIFFSCLFSLSSSYDSCSLVKKKTRRRIISKREEKKILEEKFELQIFSFGKFYIIFMKSPKAVINSSQTE